MTPETLDKLIVRPTLAWMAAFFSKERMAHIDARRFLIAVAIQESELHHRTQIGGGPGRGLWQIEAGFGAVRNHDVVGRMLLEAAGEMEVLPLSLETCRQADHFACLVARLILWADPHMLPAGQGDGWETYLRTWKPGKPRPSDWPQSWKGAVMVINGRQA